MTVSKVSKETPQNEKWKIVQNWSMCINPYNHQNKFALVYSESKMLSLRLFAHILKTSIPYAHAIFWPFGHVFQTFGPGRTNK
jgi:hypothetical protein